MRFQGLDAILLWRHTWLRSHTTSLDQGAERMGGENGTLSSWAMCDAERAWADRTECIEKQRWRIAEDPHELEDLQMTLSLEDDVDNEVLEDAMFREAKPFEVKEVSSVLQILLLSCKESESKFTQVKDWKEMKSFYT